MDTNWKKSPASLVQRFEEVLSAGPPVERRSMFGYPCAFLNGHMFCGLYQDHFILRLPQPTRVKFLAQPEAAIFEPMPGRPMKEYVLVPPTVLASDPAIQVWLREARAYVAGLPPRAAAKKVGPRKAGVRVVATPKAAARESASRAGGAGKSAAAKAASRGPASGKAGPPKAASRKVGKRG